MEDGEVRLDTMKMIRRGSARSGMIWMLWKFMRGQIGRRISVTVRTRDGNREETRSGMGWDG